MTTSRFKEGDAVLVITQHSGIFVGYFSKWIDGDLLLTEACTALKLHERNLVTLMIEGPVDSDDVITPHVGELLLTDIKSMSPITDLAMRNWTN